MKAILSLVSQGMEALAADRKNEIDGVAKEAALAASLRLLHACLRIDRDVILLLKETGQNSRQPFLCLGTKCKLSWRSLTKASMIQEWTLNIYARVLSIT